MKTFCNCMKTRDYAVVHLSDDEAQILSDSHDVGLQFFQQTLIEEKEETKMLVREVGDNKGLVGWNSPSKSKELFRMRRGTGEIVWPRSPNNFQKTMLESFKILERVISVCLFAVTDSFGANVEDFLSKCGTMETLPPNTFSASPFDLFYYLNDPHYDSVVNCHEHVDPGVLTCVPCSPTSGLAVVDHSLDEWVEIEDYLEPFQDVSILCDQVLEILSNGMYHAAVHKVTKNSSPRLSQVYELRPKATLAATLQTPSKQSNIWDSCVEVEESHTNKKQKKR